MEINKKVKMPIKLMTHNLIFSLALFKKQAWREGWKREEIQQVEREILSKYPDSMKILESYCEFPDK